MEFNIQSMIENLIAKYVCIIVRNDCVLSHKLQEQIRAQGSSPVKGQMKDVGHSGAQGKAL